MDSLTIDSVRRSRSGVVLRTVASTSSTAGDDWAVATGAASTGCLAAASSSDSRTTRGKRQPLLGLIVEALREAGDRGLVLSSIYRYVTDHSPDYTDDNSGGSRATAVWRKNVRHILSVRNFFVKTAEQNPDGRGRFWRLDEVKYAEFVAERSEPTTTRSRQPVSDKTICDLVQQ